jgi:hypothetical protein
MAIKQYVEEQLNQIETTKQIDLAKIQGFYDGAATALRNVLIQINAEEASKEKKPEEKKSPKVAKSEE